MLHFISLLPFLCMCLPSLCLSCSSPEGWLRAPTWSWGCVLYKWICPPPSLSQLPGTRSHPLFELHFFLVVNKCYFFASYSVWFSLLCCDFELVVTIIDCFEVFIEGPSDLKARAQTWSNYKQHNTIKFLISITPQGSISFMSKAWGGRVSDKHRTDLSGFLDELLPGDLVLADRGFTVEDSVG